MSEPDVSNRVDTSNQAYESPFEEPLLPLLRPDEVPELVRIYIACFDRLELFNAEAREPLFREARLHEHLIRKLSREDDWNRAACLLGEDLADFRPSHYEASFHPLLTWHQVLLGRWPPDSPTPPGAALGATDRAYIEQISRRIRRALPALRAGAAAGRLERRVNGLAQNMGTAVLLYDNRLLASAGLFFDDLEKPNQVRLGYRYPQPSDNAPALPLRASVSASYPHQDIALAKVVNAPSQQRRGLPDDQIVWDTPELPAQVAVWYYPDSGGPAICRPGRLLRELPNHGRPVVLHTFGELGRLAKGAPVFDAQWRLVGIYRDSSVMVAASQFYELRPAQPRTLATPPEERPRSAAQDLFISGLRQQIAALTEQHEAVIRQIIDSLSDEERLILKRRAESIFEEMKNLEVRVRDAWAGAHEGESGGGRPAASADNR
ncbi:MAG: trypsin-like peptidase domain-containing protein [Chloroflexales bacterium]|nr:trypsin-like peptidase domain-containing protein [Chloroflexales bacterium]